MKKITGIFLCFLFGNVHAQVLFSEIAWMGTENSHYDEWIELRNESNTEIDLKDWTIEARDLTPTIKLFGKIPEKSFFLLERTDDTSTPQTADLIYTGSLSNNGETLLLKDNSGTIIDQISAPWSAGENDSKKTMERYDVNTWQTSLNPGGTPKTKNSQEKFFHEAQNKTFQITEVSPTKINTEDEWFEFRITGDGYVDITDITFTRGTYTKKLIDVIHLLEWNESMAPNGNISEKIQKPNKAIFLPQGKTESPGIFEAYFSFTKSPVSLTDSGGEIIIKDGNGSILDSFLYPKTTKKKSGNEEYTSIWNRNIDTNEIYSLRYQPPEHPHSKNNPNRKKIINQPNAHIQTQKIYTNSINVSGEGSHENISRFEWSGKLIENKNTLWEEFLSDSKNPRIFSFTAHKELTKDICTQSYYEIELNIFDELGNTDKRIRKYPLYWNTRCELIQKEVEMEKIPVIFETKQNSPEEIYSPNMFFSDFLEFYDESQQVTLSETIEIPIKRYQRDRFFERTGVSKSLISKNIGLIFE